MPIKDRETILQSEEKVIDYVEKRRFLDKGDTTLKQLHTLEDYFYYAVHGVVR